MVLGSSKNSFTSSEYLDIRFNKMSTEGTEGITQLEQMMRLPMTREIVIASVQQKLLDQFPTESLQAAHAAAGVVYDNVLDEILATVLTWENTRSNYIDAVKLLAAKTLVHARHSIASVPEVHLQERVVRDYRRE